MKKVLLTILTLTLAFMSSVYAAPVRKAVSEYTQPDGSIITLKLCGDEFHHYYMTPEGDYVTICDDGYVRYTTLDANNNLIAGNTIVGQGEPIVSRVALSERHAQLGLSQRSMRSGNTIARRAPMRQIVQNATNEDKTVRGLILLVEFKDVKFTTGKSYINDMMNKENYSDEYGSIGSARDYFKTQSYGKFHPQFDVIGPITLSENSAYYGGNDSYGVDLRPDVMVSEACEIANSQGLVNMSDYDLDGDNWVDLVYVIFAGYGENISGADPDFMWPHAWYIYQGAGRKVKIGDVYLDAYACSAELYGISGTQPEGIGSFCHEYSHTLGLPDWYDIDYSGGMGMSDWSIMDSGCYAGDGYVPISYNAYERWYCGWLELNELTEAATVTMYDLNTDKNSAFMIASTNPNQYITLESRQKKGWDAGLPAEGMMVIAVDYDESVWNKNAPNDNPSRQRFKLIPADNKWNESSLYGDLYPYNGNTELSSTSYPKMKVYTTSINDKPITNIAYENGITTFDFKGGNTSSLDAPVATSAGNVSNNSFTAYWSPVSGAESYTLYVERLDEIETPAIPLEENFDKFTANSSINIETILDDYTMAKGWTGSKVFCNDGSAKLGNSSQGGSLVSPSYNTEEEYTVRLDVRVYNTDALSGTMKVSIDGSSRSYCDVALSQLYTDQFVTLKIACRTGGKGQKLTIESDKRIYIDNVSATNGIESKTPGRAELRFDAIAETVSGNTQAAMLRASEVTENTVFKGITATNYTVNKVVNNIYAGVYRYKVKAVAGNEESSWSNIIEVIIDDTIPDAVEGVTSDSRIYATHGIIHIDDSQEKTAPIYNMQGAVVTTLAINNGQATFAPATQGIYLVRCGQEVQKVVVR